MVHRGKKKYNVVCVVLQMCKVDQSIESDDTEENISMLTQLKQLNPDKFKL